MQPQSSVTDNIDVTEVTKFNHFHDQWWNTEGPLKTLHAINPLRLAFIQQHAQLSSAKVLDIGCGGGILTESLHHAGAQVTGIDAAPDAIASAKHHAQGLTIDYHCTTLEALDEATQATYDIITCMELLEHLPDPKSFIAHCYKYLKPGGKVFFSTINRTPLAYLTAIVGAEYVLRWLPQGTHQYHRFIKPAELAQWLRTANLELKTLQGMTYHPLTQKFALSERININYLALAEK